MLGSLVSCSNLSPLFFLFLLKKYVLYILSLGPTPFKGTLCLFSLRSLGGGSAGFGTAADGGPTITLKQLGTVPAPGARAGSLLGKPSQGHPAAGHPGSWSQVLAQCEVSAFRTRLQPSVPMGAAAGRRGDSSESSIWSN